jgi:hypothetical protein
MEPAQVTRTRRSRLERAVLSAAVLLFSVATLSCGERQSLKVIVGVAALSISKMPFVLAMDQGLYEKHGLMVEMWMRPLGSDDVRIYADPLTRLWRATGIKTPKAPDIYVDGATPMIVKLTQIAGEKRRIAVAQQTA